MISPTPIRNTKIAPGSTTRSVRNSVTRRAKLPCIGSFAARAPMIGNAIVGPKATMAPPMCRYRNSVPSQGIDPPPCRVRPSEGTVRVNPSTAAREASPAHPPRGRRPRPRRQGGPQAHWRPPLRPAPRARLRRHSGLWRSRDGDLRDAVDRSLLVQRAIRDLLDSGRLDDEVGEDRRVDLLNGGDEPALCLAGRPAQIAPDAARLLAHLRRGFGGGHRAEAFGRSLPRLVGLLAGLFYKAHGPSIYGSRQCVAER